MPHLLKTASPSAPRCRLWRFDGRRPTFHTDIVFNLHPENDVYLRRDLTSISPDVLSLADVK
jgi:hypothetical protein